MRILHVNEIAQFTGGVERVMFDIAMSLSSRGFEQSLLFLDGPLDVRFEQAFSKISDQLDGLRRLSPDVVLVHKAPSDVIEKLTDLFPVVRMVHDHDIVCPRKHKYFPLSKEICTKPVGAACVAHGCLIQRNRSGSLPIKLGSLRKQYSEMAINKKLRGLIVGSQWMKQSLIINGFNEQSVAVIPPVPSSLSSIKPSENRATDKLILFVGQMIRGKGPDKLIKALPALKGNWRAQFVGQGNLLDHCRQLASDLGIADRIDFLGMVDHEKLDTYYKNARAVVVPSIWPEPFGMVGIEAMSRARAVVGFNSGGIPDWLSNNETGLIVDTGDHVGLTLALQTLLDDEALAINLGQSGRVRVEREFTHPIFIDRLINFMERQV